MKLLVTENTSPDRFNSDCIFKVHAYVVKNLDDDSIWFTSDSIEECNAYVEFHTTLDTK